MKPSLISMSNGKGDKPRPVDKETFDKNWQKIFKKKKKPKKPKKDEETNE